MNSARSPLNVAFGAATAAAVCAGMLTVPTHQAAPQIVVREAPVVLQAFTINDVVTRVSDAITLGLTVAPVWYLWLPISVPMSIGIGFGLTDLIPVVGDSFGLNWALSQVGRTLVGLGLSAVVYAVGPVFMAVSSLLGITYPSVLPAAARPASARTAAAIAAPVGDKSALAPRPIRRSATASPVTAPARSKARAASARAEKQPAAAAASRTTSKRQAR